MHGPDKASIAAAFPGTGRACIVAIMTNTLTTPLPLVAGRWPLDAAHSRIGFTIRHLGVAKVRGLFRDFEATFDVGESLDDTAISATVDLASIDTANADRDAHVRSSELLDVVQRPTMTFVSTAITGDGADWTLAGDLTIGDVTRPMKLQRRVRRGRRLRRWHATRRLRGDRRTAPQGLRTGLRALGAFLGEVVKIDLDFEFVEPQPR